VIIVINLKVNIMAKLTKALFTDLDGTLIRTNSGRKFPIHSADWRFIPETLKALTYFYKQGYKIIIVTNQGGIGEGYMAEKVFIDKIDKICCTLEKRLEFKANSVSYFYCTGMDGYDRKPNPGMAFEAALEYELDIKESVMLGDYITDMQFARNAGMDDYYDILQIIQIDWENK